MNLHALYASKKEICGIIDMRLLEVVAIKAELETAKYTGNKDEQWFAYKSKRKGFLNVEIAGLQGQVRDINKRVRELLFQEREERMKAAASQEARKAESEVRREKSFFDCAKAMLSADTFERIMRASLGLGA